MELTYLEAISDGLRTALGEDGSVVTAGGRVLTVGGRAPTLEAAAAIAYRTVDCVHWNGEQHRRDIGHRAL